MKHENGKCDADRNLQTSIFSDIIRIGLRQKDFSWVVKAANARGYYGDYSPDTSWNKIIRELVSLPQIPEIDGPSVGALLSGNRTINGDADIPPDSVGSAMSELASRLNAADFKYVVQTLAKTTLIERESGKWPMLEPEIDLAGDFSRPNVNIPEGVRWEVHRIVTSGFQNLSISGCNV